MNADELDDLRQLLATHRQTLAILLRQVAKHGEANAPPAQLGGIAEARTRIAGLKQALRAQGEAVEDRLGDVAAPVLPADSNSGGVDDGQFERRYRRAVQSELERIEIFGVPIIDDKTKRQDVSVAYVSLDIELDRPDDDRDDRELVYFSIDDITRRERQTVAMPVNQLLATSHRFVISGEAGSGKTTLLQWIALRSVGRDLPAELAEWNETVPFFIRLRTLKEGQGFPRLDELTDLIGAGDAGRPPDNWVQQQFDAGRALVLVDGVDELPQARRELMLKELRRLVHMFPRACYLITSRPLRVKEQPWQEWKD